ncbi:MAG: autotransporter outer rane beta-barrel protein [Pseudomonas sp.]|nr:autotransporter outer rane beta-barrel protein [Pseudomonas sp.]
MKTSTIPQDITLAVCTVSTSLLLYASLEVRAAPQDEPIPWYRGNIPLMTLINPSAGSNPNLNRVARWRMTAAKVSDGNVVASSVEGDYSIGLGENWVIEPQAQLINLRLSADNQNTASANNPADSLTAWSGRVGARLKGNYQVSGLPVEPYLRTNLWHSYSNSGPLSLGQVDKISSSRYSTSVEVGLGLLANVTPSVSLFVSGDYSGSTDNAFGLIGNIGVRIRW